MFEIDEAKFAFKVRRELAMARGESPLYTSEKQRKGHAKLNSAHEAYAVILEELDEFWEQVRMKREVRDPAAMLTELVQIAAMAQRAAEDLGLIERGPQ